MNQMTYPRATPYLNLQVGDVVDAAADPLFGDECRPEWFVLLVEPQAELSVSARLLRQGAADCWYPTEIGWRWRRGGRRKEKYLRRIAPGYVFLLANAQVAWHRMADATLGKVRHVAGIDGVPVPVPDREMAKMQQVPQHLEALKAKVEAELEAARLAELPVEGGRAVVRTGPFEGFVVDVLSIHAGIARAVLSGKAARAEVRMAAAEMKRLD